MTFFLAFQTINLKSFSFSANLANVQYIRRMIMQLCSELSMFIVISYSLSLAQTSASECFSIEVQTHDF